jgi:hypothetical protein
MSTRKQRRKAARSGAQPVAEAADPKAISPAPPPPPPPATPTDPAEERRAQRRMSVVGFALTGMLMAFLAGANQPVSVVESASPLIQAARIGSAVAVQAAELGRGLETGLMGLLLGASFGYSLFLRPSLMFMSWLGGGVGLVMGLATGITLVGGVGWTGGFLAVLLAAFKARAGDL